MSPSSSSQQQTRSEAKLSPNLQRRAINMRHLDVCRPLQHHRHRSLSEYAALTTAQGLERRHISCDGAAKRSWWSLGSWASGGEVRWLSRSAWGVTMASSKALEDGSETADCLHFVGTDQERFSSSAFEELQDAQPLRRDLSFLLLGLQKPAEAAPPS
ncbi:hypothetical protein PSPO01_11839 [Paraphaeosphaeria sporulosa]